MSTALQAPLSLWRVLPAQVAVDTRTNTVETAPPATAETVVTEYAGRVSKHFPFYPQYVGPPAKKRDRAYRPSLSGPSGELIRKVAESYKVSVEELCGPSAERRLSWPRQELMALLYETGRYSYPAIGRFLGGRDHTTVLHGVRAHRARQAMRMAAE